MTEARARKMDGRRLAGPEDQMSGESAWADDAFHIRPDNQRAII